MCKLSHDKLSDRLHFEYLENPVECVLSPEPKVFDGHATPHILSFADIREPTATANVTDMYELFPQSIGSW